MDNVKLICYNACGAVVYAGVPEDFRLRRDEDAPADSLEVTLPELLATPVHRVRLVVNGQVFFEGPVDEQNRTATAEKRETELVCRSYEAILLDNQAVAGTVRQPSRGVMEHWQLRPLGLTCTGGSGAVCGGEYTVAFGQSVYRALEGFARAFGQGTPWMPDRHTVCFSPREVTHWVLPEVIAATRFCRPVERISCVAVQNPVNGCYSAVTENRPAVEAGVVRRRFLKAGAAVSAREQIAAGEKAYTYMQLTLPRALCIRPGDTVDACLRPLGLEDLHKARVTSVWCTGAAGGCQTRLQVEG